MSLTISTNASNSDVWQGFNYAWKTSNSKTQLFFYLFNSFPIAEYKNSAVKNYDYNDILLTEQH